LRAFSADTFEPPDALAIAVTRSALTMEPPYYASARAQVKRRSGRTR
jgi:hypothetical protein